MSSWTAGAIFLLMKKNCKNRCPSERVNESSSISITKNYSFFNDLGVQRQIAKAEIAKEVN